MLVRDIENDMRDMIPERVLRDSAYLFGRMAEVAFALAAPGPGRRILDVASGLGQDAVALAATGAFVVGAEPSRRMAGWAAAASRESAPGGPRWVRGWSDGLPFASGSFDAVICKGSIDHFDDPCGAIGEMARVTAPAGRVVLAIANFESLGFRVQRALDDLRETWLGAEVARGRRVYDVPTDHFTRYDAGLMRAQAARHLLLDAFVGVSLGWGVGALSRVLERLPAAVAARLLRVLDTLARQVPAWADVIVLAGRPRPRATRAAARASR